MIEKIIIIALIVFAIWYSMQEGEIFGWLGAWFERVLPGWMHNPVFACFICMTPWYGTGLYFLIPILPEWIPIVIAAMGLNGMAGNLFAKEEIEVNVRKVKKLKRIDPEKEAQDIYK